ncbi:helix-turn-helix domain-containing protein [Salipaludibacillus sp. HK11]|uniref:helix-turn-helix domain-containing protein n=1 Tax=Salipaludibacillus sp. HK11 TaxID=3394320 RepID=UPI0039FC6EBF
MIKNQMYAFEWVYDDEQFTKLLKSIEEQRISGERLNNIVKEVASEWNNKYPFIQLAHTECQRDFNSWYELKKWLGNYRRTIKMTVATPYAEEVVNSVLLSLTIIKQNLHENLTAAEVAKDVNMSRSYFNKSFKDIVGQSFHTYLREWRIEKAKSMIEQSNEQIHLIAEQIGYLDDKHFSRIFREHVGCLPSEYRKKSRKVEK